MNFQALPVDIQERIIFFCDNESSKYLAMLLPSYNYHRIDGDSEEIRFYENGIVQRKDFQFPCKIRSSDMPKVYGWRPAYFKHEAYWRRPECLIKTNAEFEEDGFCFEFIMDDNDWSDIGWRFVSNHAVNKMTQIKVEKYPRTFYEDSIRYRLLHYAIVIDGHYPYLMKRVARGTPQEVKVAIDYLENFSTTNEVMEFDAYQFLQMFLPIMNEHCPVKFFRDYFSVKK